MKVEGSGKAGGPKGVSKAGGKKRTGEASFSGMVENTEETTPAQTVSKAVSVAQLDALLSIQEAPEGTAEEKKKRAQLRAESLLDQLDRIKIALLSGGVPQTTLSQLARMVQGHRENIIDPKLANVLDEIDLRVQVELAKYSMK